MEYKLTFKKYSEALKENRLLGLKCIDCGAIAAPPVMACRKCGSTNLEIIQLSGKGKIQTFTTNNVAPEGWEKVVPYVIVLVALEEGPWLMGHLAGIDPTKAGMELVGKSVTTGHDVFPGDKYSAGEGVRPVFSLA
jgi:hypothetical protein